MRKMQRSHLVTSVPISSPPRLANTLLCICSLPPVSSLLCATGRLNGDPLTARTHLRSARLPVVFAAPPPAGFFPAPV